MFRSAAYFVLTQVTWEKSSVSCFICLLLLYFHTHTPSHKAGRQIQMYNTNPSTVGSMLTRSSLCPPPGRRFFPPLSLSSLGCYSSGLEITVCDFAFNFLHHLTTCFYVTNLSKIYFYLCVCVCVCVSESLL